MEGVQDHIFLNIHGKETTYEMWKALKNLFQNTVTTRIWHSRTSFEISRCIRATQLHSTSTGSHNVMMNLVKLEFL